MHPTVAKLWRRYLRVHPSAPAEVPAAYHFCDNRDDAEICAELVLAGRKRATAAAVAELELAGLPLPKIGDYAIVTRWDGEAVAVIRTVAVEVKPFGEVGAAFAREEGEGDLTLQWWRDAHRAYYERVLSGSGHEVDDRLAIVCERFEVVMRA